MKQLKLDLPGIHCPSCTKLIKLSLTGVEGILETNLDLETKSGELSYDESLISEKEILALIKDEAGYEAIVK